MSKFKLKEFNDLAQGVYEAGRRAVGSVTKTGVIGGTKMYMQRMDNIRKIYSARNKNKNKV